MTSEQRIAEWVDRLDTGLIDTDSLALVRAALPDLIASVRAEAFEEAAKVCDARATQWADGKPPHEQSPMVSNKVTEGLCTADAIRALAKERKGEE